MKKIIITAILALVFSATGAMAHGPMSFSEAEGSGVGMMRFVEETAIANPELHEEMEGLMQKMMEGTLTEEEAGKVAEYMKQYPGPQGMMIGRMMSGGGMGLRGGKTGGWGDMMGNWAGGAAWWHGTWFLWVHVISFILVWAFLALAIIALWKWLEKQK